MGVHGALDLEPARAKGMLAVDSELGCSVLVTNACFVAHPGRSKEAAERCFDDERTVPIERLGSAADMKGPQRLGR